MINLLLFSLLFIYFFKDSNNKLIDSIFETNFLIDNENWFITGNKKLEPVKHQKYNYGNKMSNYIVATDNLVNVDWKNKDDKDLWYFKSPPIKLQFDSSKKPVLLLFTMMSFAGDFTKLNYCHALIKIIGKRGTFFYPYVKKYDGNIETFNVPLINSLWVSNDNTSLLDSVFEDEFQIEILGDWTRGVEIIGLDNIQIHF
jgi:hypothetical protein